MSFISLKFAIGAIVFVLSSGILYARKFRDHPVLVTLAGLMALVASVFLSIELGKIVTEQDNGDPLPRPLVAKLSIQERYAERMEGNFEITMYTFIVTRRGNLSGKVSVGYAVSGGAVDADDFGGQMPSGEIIIGDGQEQGLIEIPVSGDRNEELNEYFTVRLSNPIPDNTMIVTQTARGIIRNDDDHVPQTPSSSQDDKGTPVTLSPSESANDASRIGSRLVYDVISLENVEDSERSEVPFPSAYFRSRLAQELSTNSTMISGIRVGVAFIEPYESRRHATGGTIIGYILVSLPSLADCTRKFGPQAYSFTTATTGIMKATNDYISEIANWIRHASLGEKLTCPKG